MLLLFFCLSCLCPDCLDVTRAGACSVCPHLYCSTLDHFPRALAPLPPNPFPYPFTTLCEWIDAVSLDSATERRPVMGMVSLGSSSPAIVILCASSSARGKLRKGFEGIICKYGVQATKCW